MREIAHTYFCMQIHRISRFLNLDFFRKPSTVAAGHAPLAQKEFWKTWIISNCGERKREFSKNDHHENIHRASAQDDDGDI